MVGLMLVGLIYRTATWERSRRAVPAPPHYPAAAVSPGVDHRSRNHFSIIYRLAEVCALKGWYVGTFFFYVPFAQRRAGSAAILLGGMLHAGVDRAGDHADPPCRLWLFLCRRLPGAPPFYRNHVAYASIIVVFLPFIWYVRKWYPAYSGIWWILSGSLLILLLTIQLSYTRAAYVSVVIAIGAFYIIRWRLTRYVLLLSWRVHRVCRFMSFSNRYLDYAPNYETTVSHQDFNNLLLYHLFRRRHFHHGTPLPLGRRFQMSVENRFSASNFGNFTILQDLYHHQLPTLRQRQPRQVGHPQLLPDDIGRTVPALPAALPAAFRLCLVARGSHLPPGACGKDKHIAMMACCL